MDSSPRKTETAEYTTMADGERVLYYPYLDPQPMSPGGGRAIGERENGEQIFQYDLAAIIESIERDRRAARSAKRDKQVK